MDHVQALLSPSRLATAAEVLDRPSAVPAAPGVYAWYFDQLPPAVPTEGCHRVEDKTLLYVGISPKAPSKGGGPPSRQNIRKRLRYHYRGNAYGSTLRLTLGTLLSPSLGIGLRRVGSGTRLTFSVGEHLLSEWMANHAFVTWLVTDEPWLLETQMIGHLTLPLNLDQNANGSFRAKLKQLRAEQRGQALKLPIAPQ
jgi:hypothetical protein